MILEKVSIVEQGNLLKFTQAQATKSRDIATVKLSHLLLKTRGRELVEVRSVDQNLPQPSNT